jgi:hypothetical protein
MTPILVADGLTLRRDSGPMHTGLSALVSRHSSLVANQLYYRLLPSSPGLGCSFFDCLSCKYRRDGYASPAGHDLPHRGRRSQKSLVLATSDGRIVSFRWIPNPKTS